MASAGHVLIRQYPGPGLWPDDLADATVRGGITVKPHVQAIADALEAEFGPLSFGTYEDHSPPEGPTQAIDIFTPDNPAGYALQDRICAFIRANVKRFGGRYCIRRAQIWNIERDDEDWRDQGVTGNRTRDHMDHVHYTAYAIAPGPFGPRIPAPTPSLPAKPKEPDVAKIAYPVSVLSGETRRFPVPAIGGGLGWTKAAVTFASTGVRVLAATVGPKERPILDAGGKPLSSADGWSGRFYADLRAGDEWVSVALAPTPDGALEFMVEASDG